MSIRKKNKTSSCQRILVIDVRMATPDNDAASLRLYHLMRILKDLSFQIVYITCFPSSWPPYTRRLHEDAQYLRAQGIQVPVESLTKSVEEFLDEQGRLYDIVILTTEYVATKHMAHVRKYAPHATVFYDTLDLHYRRYYREAKISGNIHALKRALQTKRRELTAVRRADYCLTVSEMERDILEKECPGVKVHVVSSIHASTDSVQPFQKRRDLLFVGSLLNAGNIDSVKFFLKEIFPLIKKELPHVQMFIVGNAPHNIRKDLKEKDVIFSGHVPDLTPHFNNCRLSVAPLRFGAGVKGKVLTSLGFGVPVVATSIAAEGMHLTHNKNILVADAPQNFSQTVVSCYRNETRWKTLSENGLEVISRYFSYAAVRAKLIECFARIEREN